MPAERRRAPLFGGDLDLAEADLPRVGATPLVARFN
jgi:hypothetical protein